MGNTRNWIVSTWTRHEVNERGESITVPGAKVTDRDTGLIYCATIGTGRGGPWLTYLSILTPNPGTLFGADSPEQRINPPLLGRVPTRALAEAVADHLRKHEESGAAIVVDQVSRTTGDRPDLRELAEQYPQHKRVDLAALYGVSPSTLDRWVAEARRRGMLPPATTGRPRNPQTPGGKPAGSRERKNKK